jgi:hypothetical protein
MELDLIDQGLAGLAEDDSAARSVASEPAAPELLDWDVFLSAVPPRPAGTLQVHLTASGRSRPLPVSDPGD